MTNTIHSVMKPILIGKELKYVKEHKSIMQPYNILVKKSSGVTDKQLQGGNPRFVRTLLRKRKIGYMVTFETSKIVDIRVNQGDWNSANYLTLVLENGREEPLEVDSEIIDIDRDTIIIKYNC